MKPTLYFFIFCAFFSASRVQASNDSLWSIYQNTKQHDTIRLNALNTLAANFQSGRPDSLLYVADLMLELAEGRYAVRYYGAAYGHKAYAYMIMGQAHEAIENFRIAYAKLEKTGQKKQQAGNLINRGGCYSMIGLYDSAIYYFQLGVDLCESIGDKEFWVNGLTNIGTVYNNTGQYAKAIKKFTEVIPLAKETNNQSALSGAYTNIGQSYFKQGEIYKALNFYDKALHIHKNVKNRQGETHTLKFIGEAYQAQEDHKAAREKLEEGLKLAREFKFLNLEGDIMISLGNTLSSLGDDKQAKDMYEASYAIAEQLGDARSAVVCLANLAAIAQDAGEILKARSLQEQVLEISRMVNIQDFIAGALINLGGNYSETGDYIKAESMVSEGLRIAQELGDINWQWKAADNLVKIYGALGNSKKATEMHVLYTLMKDSVNSNTNRNATLRREYKFAYETQALQDSLVNASEQALKDKEIQRRKILGNGLAIGLVFVLGFAGVVYNQRNKIAKEKKVSEELLHNILPEEVAAELKATGEAEAKLINDTTVLFTDFKGFTSISERLSPKELVSDIHTCFSAFDRIMDKYGVEKIKTIGDAYMAAGGLPDKSSSTVKDVVEAALEIAEFIETKKQQSIAENKEFFEIRIGIHTGPVVAGIVGVKKFQYDIWGDTVNTASRMESNGEIGRVNISQYTYNLLKDDSNFKFEYRGKIHAKGKGEVDMYFVERA